MSTADPTPTGDHLVGLADTIADGLLDRTLPKSRWTHEGHLLACIALVRRLGPTEALVVLRAAIPPYNVATGVANTTTGGYHDTITVYFVWAVARLLQLDPHPVPRSAHTPCGGLGPPGNGGMMTTAGVLGHPSVEREALFAWWERETLFSAAARLGWRPPTLAGDGGPAPTEWLQPELIEI